MELLVLKFIVLRDICVYMEILDLNVHVLCILYEVANF